MAHVATSKEISGSLAASMTYSMFPVTASALPCAGVGVAPELVLAGTNLVPYYAATVTLTTEV